MAADTYERVLDVTARIPGQVYVCPYHYGFREAFDKNDGGHYPKLPDDRLCPRCVRYEDLCDKWISTLGDYETSASVRCMRRKGHGQGSEKGMLGGTPINQKAHLCDDLDGRRFAWMEQSPYTVLA